MPTFQQIFHSIAKRLMKDWQMQILPLLPVLKLYQCCNKNSFCVTINCIICHFIAWFNYPKMALYQSGFSSFRTICLSVLRASSWDMFLNIPLLADWQMILAWREQLVNDALLCANKKCINFDYQIGQRVLRYDKTLYGKFKTKTKGPFDILWVLSNGTVTISLQPGITECANVCHTLPYRDPTPL